MSQTRYRRLIRLSITVLFGFWASACAAHNFCVTDVTQLNQALIDSGRSGPYASEAVIVQLAAGTYVGNFFVDRDAGFYIVGGYNEDCSHLTPDASLTILDGNNSGTVLTIFAPPTIVSNLTVQNGSSMDAAAGLLINNYDELFIGFDGPVSLDDLIVRNNHSQTGAGGIFAWGGHDWFYMANCLVYGNSSTGAAGGVALRSDATTTLIYDNTIADNEGAPGGLAVGSLNAADVSNNILWGNVGGDLAVNNTIDLRYNDYGSLEGTPASSLGDMSIDPAFVDPQGMDYHLAPDSPARQYSPVLEGVDLNGNPHPTSGNQDIGAYYDSVFSDGFEDASPAIP